MKYKVLIVDDEKKTREGLAKFVDWDLMGFEVVTKLTDGKEAIEYLEKHHVDIVFTDIKMTFVSGIELAKYIYDHKKGIKVVLISAYKEFEYAKEALRYNVVNYILKPISIEEIHKLFIQLKQQMDLENKEKEDAINAKEQLEEMITLLRREFFTDIFLGTFRNKIEIDNKYKLLNFGFDLTSCRCCTVNVNINEYERYLKSSWCYGRESLYTAVLNFFQAEGTNIIYFPVVNIKDNLTMLAVCCNKEMQEEFPYSVQNDLSNIVYEIKNFLKLDISADIDKSFNNIYELGMNSPQFTQKTIDSMNSSYHKNANLKIEEQIKLMATHIISGNFKAAESVFDNIMEEIGIMKIKAVKSFVIDLFVTIVSKLIELDESMDITNYKGICFEELFTKQSIEAISSWGKKNIQILIENANSGINAQGQSSIDKAKRYIRDNYNKDITLEDVANHIYLNSAYLSRLFKEQTGENFSDYLIKIRMQKAVELLNDKRYRVNEVCTMIGYDSIRYFYRLFKRYNGATPTEYRKSLWGSDGGYESENS